MQSHDSAEETRGVISLRVSQHLQAVLLVLVGKNLEGMPSFLGEQNMARIITLNSGGREVKAIEMDFEIERENWNEYKLLDGGSVRVKTTVSRIYKVVDADGQPQYNADGSPTFAVAHKSDVVSSE